MCNPGHNQKLNVKNYRSLYNIMGVVKCEQEFCCWKTLDTMKQELSQSWFGFSRRAKTVLHKKAYDAT